MATSLLILGCSQRKKRTSRLLPAIERYDGPNFQVLRRCAEEAPDSLPDSFVLSARFGLIPGSYPVPRYDRRLADADILSLRSRVETQLKRVLDKHQPERMFISVGQRYWALLEGPLARDVPAESLVIASGGIGGRASQLAHWLQLGEDEGSHTTPEPIRGKATLLGKTVRLIRAEVLRTARSALLASPAAARRFETWYVAVGQDRVAPKWLVSVLFDKPVARFRTADARRVLSHLGVSCIYASR